LVVAADAAKLVLPCEYTISECDETTLLVGI